MAEMWKAGDDVVAVVRDLVAKYHPHLALCVDEIAVVFHEKATIVGDHAITGKTGKAPQLLSVLGDIKYKFLIKLAGDTWLELNDKQRVALLDHHLCGCRVDENPQGNTKYYTVPPDVAFYKGEIERHGVWRTSSNPPNPDMIKELFGEDEEADPTP